VQLSDARQELSDRGFDYLSASRQNLMLNRALVDFEDAYDWPWLRKTATGAAPLTIADLKHVRKVQDSTGQEYMGLDESADVDLTETGTPGGWWIDDTSGSPVVTAYPVGAVTFTVYYVASSAPLSSDTASPLIPSAYHPLWVDFAVIRAYQDSDNFAAANALRQSAMTDLQQVIERYETRNRQNSRHMLIRAGSLDG
jgi:hypothetical protein